MIVAILWAIMALVIFIQYAPACKGLDVFSWIVVSIIFIIGAPFFMIVEILETILSCFLPEGWDNDEM